MAMQTPNNNKPRKYKETERFTIRRLAFWLSTAAVVYFSQHWDVSGMAISAAVLSPSPLMDAPSIADRLGWRGNRDRMFVEGLGPSTNIRLTPTFGKIQVTELATCAKIP